MSYTIFERQQLLNDLRDEAATLAGQGKRNDSRYKELMSKEIPAAQVAFDEANEPRGIGGIIPGLQDAGEGVLLEKYHDRDEEESFEVSTEFRGIRSDEKVEDHLRKSGVKFEDGGYDLGHVCRAIEFGPTSELEERAMAEGTASAGGHTVADKLSARVIDRLRARSRAIQAGASTIVLDTLNTKYARLATGATASWREENAVITESNPTFDAITFTPKSLAVLVKVSKELVEDSVNLGQALEMEFSRGFATELDRVALYGSGTSPELRGVKNVSGIGQVDMGTNGDAFTNYDPFVDSWLEIVGDNAQDPTGFIMAPRTMASLAKLKDGSNQPMQKPELITSIPMLTSTTIPVNETQGTANNASTVLAGYWPDLAIGIRHSLRIVRAEERFIDNWQTGFVAVLRADVAVFHPESFAEIIGITP